MKLVAWYPKGISAPMELLSVMAPLGKLTEYQWLELLADRVTELVKQEPDPHAACDQADRYLRTDWSTEAEHAGQYYVLGNYRFRENLNLLTIENPFPAQVTADDPEATDAAQEAIEGTDFISWVDHLQSVVSESSLE